MCDFDIQNTIQQNPKRMGNICAANDLDKAAIECPHKKRPKKGGGRSQIKTEINQNYGNHPSM